MRSFLFPLTAVLAVLISIPSFSLDLTKDTSGYFSIGADIRREKKVEASEYKTNSVTHLGLHLQKKNLSLLEELTYNSDSSRSGNLEISTSTLGWMNWAQYHFLIERNLHPFVALGLGLSRSTIETKLGGTTREDTSKTYIDGGAGLGGVFKFSKWFGAIGEVRGVKYEQMPDPVASLFLALQVTLK
ncbi:MAG TPA: hypothetical protein DCL41_02000 [Bdellovibrionales bacterium]|nr:hypothetical protein [Pseudobdellovibrionaceae bacterium]HAG90612.1 hypothetical protein [Bdellovibrionales bacterium]|tara:strand:+ start:1554 stop:2114 length:561 start_codon:yes stop_codon:yes gene_type:complete